MSARPPMIAKDWLTAAELAKLGLRGFPTGKSGVLKLVDREEWQDKGVELARRREGRGGGFEFHIDILPAAARHHLAELRYGHAIPAQRCPDPELQPRDFTRGQACRRDARLEILALFDGFHRDSGLAQRTAEFEFARLYNHQQFPVSDWVRIEVGAVSAPSLQRWRRQREKGKAHDLGGRYKRGKKSVLARANDGQVELYIGALIAKQPHLSAGHVRDIVRDQFGDALENDGELVPVPPLRTFQRFMTGWKADNKVALLKITNPDGFKNSTRITGTNMNAHVTRLNELWEIDASPADAMTTDGRRNIYCVVDIYSRRMLFSVSETAKTHSMLLLLRKAILLWGVPEVLRSDNGSDFISYEAKRAINSLGIEHDITAPFSPEQKGTVERGIGTLQRGLMPLLPGFIGHNVADRKVIENRRAFAQRLGDSDDNIFCVDLSADELQEKIDQWVAAKYEHTPHAGIGSEKPALRAASYGGTVRRVESERALDLLLAPIAGRNGIRTVTKRGIRLDGAMYLTSEIMPGEQVFLRHDPKDMGRIVCFTPGEEVFLGYATCPDFAGIDPKEFTVIKRAEQARRIREEVAPLKQEIARIKPRDLIDAVLRTAERDAGAVTAFPRPHVPHETPALEAAMDATAEFETVPGIPATPAKNVVPGNVTPLRTFETKEQRFARAVDIQGRIDEGEAVDVGDAKWLGGYQTGPEFRAMKMFFEDFGDQAQQ